MPQPAFRNLIGFKDGPLFIAPGHDRIVGRWLFYAQWSCPALHITHTLWLCQPLYDI